MRICKIPVCTSPYLALGYCVAHYQKFKKYGDPLVVKQSPHGSGSTRNGYKFYTVDGKQKREHITIAEKALGKPLPIGACVHHVDENRANNRNDNLVICPDNSYHMALHMRLRALRACGNSDWHKCLFCGKYDDPANMLPNRQGRNMVHQLCRSEYFKNRRRNHVDQNI